MKVIDLLNKIAKGEEVPKKIKWNDDEYSYVNDTCKNYANDYEDFMSVVDGSCLNDEVEIIEEDTFEDIEGFNISYNLGFVNYENMEVLKKCLNKDFQTIYDTLDLLIKRVLYFLYSQLGMLLMQSI
jgi:hypothetical protein